MIMLQDMAPSLIFLYFAILPVLMLFAYFVDRKTPVYKESEQIDHD